MALANYRHRIRQRLVATGIVFHWDVELEPCPSYSSRQLVQIMRIIQESLTNAIRHAEASNITIRAKSDGHGSLLVEVVDDGIGMSENPEGGRGLINMKKRAAELAGMLTIEPSAPGTRVRLELGHGQNP